MLKYNAIRVDIDNESSYIVPGLGDFGDRFYTL